MGASERRLATYAEYLALEERSVEKHEFCEGFIVAMAGGTPEHARLKTNLTTLVGVALKGHRCAPFDSDLRIRIPATSLATYPDLSVICGPLQRDAQDKNAAINPTLLVEVLSPSTAAYDRGEKLDHYGRLPTLREVVFVDSERVHVDVYRRLGDEGWERHGYGPGQHVPFASLDIALAVDEIYAGWAELAAPPAAEPRTEAG